MSSISPFQAQRATAPSTAAARSLAAGVLKPPVQVSSWRKVAWVLAAGLAGLGGCDQLGIETPQKAAERQQADAKAIGGACRHALRAIEDCYTLNPKADKAAVFGGWREMDEYMRENKLEGVAPVVPRPVPAASSKASAPAKDDEDDAGDSAEDSQAKSAPGKKAKPH